MKISKKEEDDDEELLIGCINLTSADTIRWVPPTFFGLPIPGFCVRLAFFRAANFGK